MTLEEVKKTYAKGTAVRIPPQTDDEKEERGIVEEVVEDDEGIWIRVKHDDGEVIDYDVNDVEVVEKPKRRRKKKTEDKKEEQEVAEEKTTTNDEMMDENVLPWEDEVVTPEEIDRATRNPDEIPEGEYEFEISKVEFVAPREKSPGGVRVRFKVITPPVGVEPPEDGWPSPPRLFRRWDPEYMEDWMQQAQKYDRFDLLRLIQAAGVDVSGGVKMSDAVKALVGKRVIATVRHRESSEGGRRFQDIGRFRSLEA